MVDSTKLGNDDQVNPTNLKPTDRAYWLSRVGAEILGLADECLKFINEVAKHPRSLNYNRQYIGLANSFVYFNPKRFFLRVTIYIHSTEEWSQRLEKAGMYFWSKNDGELKFRLRPKDFEENKALIRELLHAAVKEDKSE